MPAIASEPPPRRGPLRRTSSRRSSPRRLGSPGRTLRFRLTVLYGTLFAVAGAALLAITYALVDHASSGDGAEIVAERVSGSSGPGAGAGTGTVAVGTDSGVQVGGYAKMLIPKYQSLSPELLQKLAVGRAIASAQRADVLRRLLEESGIALGIVTVIAIVMGYWLARHSLSPVRRMAAKARAISEANLHERLAVAGPVDELKELGDTFDRMLARLEGAFTAQRTFVANASHELRTPMTYQRTLLELAVSDPDADAETLRDTCRRALRASEEQERLVEALLTLARSQRGLSRREPVDLAESALEAVSAVRSNPADPTVTIDVVAGPATTGGEPNLVRRLITNLVDNAVRYNTTGGSVTVSTETTGEGDARLRVVNSGPAVPPDRLPALFQPFQRLEGRSARNDGGLGLGLSIVAATAEAHGARLRAKARAQGGLDITVEFPSPSAERSSAGATARR